MSGMYFVKGLGVGMVAGATVALIAMPKKKAEKNNCGKAIKTIGEIIDNIADTITH